MADVDFYGDMQATAVEMLEEFGAPAVVTHQKQTFSVQAVVYPSKKGYIDHEMGSAIFRDLESVIVGSIDTTLEIAQGDTLALNGRDYVFEEVNPVAPGGINIIFQGKVSR
jgi:hypothetical protein